MFQSYLLSLVTLSSGRVFNVNEFDAWDGCSDCTSQIQDAFDAIKNAGGSGNTVFFPTGTYTFGPVHFEGLTSATIQFDSNTKLISLQDASKWDQDGDQDDSEYIPWIQGSGCTDMTVKGGSFDHNHDYWLFAPNEKQHNARPYLMRYTGMIGFTIHNVKLYNSPHTHLKIAASSDVKVYKVQIETKLDSENTDGIMLSGVIGGHVDDSHVQNGDDCMKANDGCQDILYENGSCRGGHGLSIGGGSSTLDIKNIMFRNFDLYDMPFGSRIKFKTDTKGSLRNVTYQDLRMYHVKNPLYITTGYQSSPDMKLSSSEMKQPRFIIEDLYYLDIHAWDYESQDSDSQHLSVTHGGGATIKNPGTFLCDDTAPCKGLHLRNVNIETNTKWVADKNLVGGWADYRVYPDASKFFDMGPTWYTTITPTWNNGLCLDLPGNEVYDGAALWLWQCLGTESQRWVVDGYQVRFGADESMCIDAGDMSDGLQLYLWQCNGYPQQTWGYDPDAYRMYLTSIDKCVDFYGDWQASGQPLHIWQCTGDWNQQWSLWDVGYSQGSKSEISV